MARSTAESLALSSLLNTANPLHLVEYGVQARHFAGYRAEFEWTESYVAQMGKTPTWEEFVTKFPDFPVSRTQDDARWPVHQMFEAWSSKQILRGLIGAGAAVRNGSPYEAKEILNQIEIAQFAAKPSNMLLDFDFVNNYTHQAQDTIQLPWSTLAAYATGIAPGELWYVCARPNQGKSWLLLEMIVSAAMQGFKVIIYSLEMTKFKMQQRAHLLLAKALGHQFAFSELRKGMTKDYRDLLAEISEKVTGEIHIHTPKEGRVTPAVIAAAASDYDLVVVDHVGLVRANAGNRSIEDYRLAAANSNELKEIALASQTRVLGAVQINREGDGRRPATLKHLSGTDSYAQDADVVVTMARPSSFTMHALIAKNRDGQANVSFWGHFDVEYGNFSEVTRAVAEQIRDDMMEES